MRKPNVTYELGDSIPHRYTSLGKRNTSENIMSSMSLEVQPLTITPVSESEMLGRKKNNFAYEFGDSIPHYYTRLVKQN